MDTAKLSYQVLSSVGKSPFGNEKDTVEGEETDSVVTGASVPFMVLVALVAVGSGIASMVLTVSTVVDVACGCLFIVSPVVIVQKYKLRKLGTLRQEQNELRNEVNKLSAEMDSLKQQNIELSNEATELSSVAAEYKKLSKERGEQVDRLVAIVKENGEIQNKIKKNLERAVMQQALDTVLKCDTDEDFSISQKEIPQLKLRLSNIPGVEFDKENFDKLFKGRKGDLKLQDIMEMFRNLKADIPEEDNIFHLKTEKLPANTPRKQRSFLGF